MDSLFLKIEEAETCRDDALAYREAIIRLTDNERAQLEENLLRDGIRDPLVVWNDILIDGHNRYNIARLHNLEFTTVEMAFDSRDAVKIWIADNQFGRRDLTVYERSLLAIKIKPSIAVLAKERQGERNDLNIVKNSCQSSEEPAPVSKSKSARENKTDYQVAQKAGVSEDTIRKVERIEQQATPEIKAALRTGDMSINAAYNKVQQAARKEDIQRQVDEIEQRAIEKPDGLFDVIVIDPPWGYVREAHHGSFDAQGRRCTNPYPEMTQDELKAIELPAAALCRHTSRRRSPAFTERGDSNGRLFPKTSRET